ncbi:hypothetical protein NDR87_11075 [Nocardia sp. CDC159]|uniref:Mce-associated membrane protein n=1 Tax=Nocardia pulmonis TaxID=2951408 RepID=A0A9X2E4D1_9NOCA|nr:MULTISPECIES: hypothetical protein [Nocardia]MCM6774014.1 hypothetical protein [Nocardia pulmonis]MCM6786901.1 hypothetical protein [Nocardia sp. CDC159]
MITTDNCPEARAKDESGHDDSRTEPPTDDKVAESRTGATEERVGAPDERAPRWRRHALTAAVVLLTGALGGTGWVAVDQHRRVGDLTPVSARYHDEQAALAAATMFFATVTTYDHRNLDAYTGAVADASTGTFHDRYSAAGGPIKQLLSDAQVISTGKVVSAGIAGYTGDRITVIAFIDQTYQNKDTAQPRTETLRMSADLVRVGDRWLVSDMSPK